MFSTAFDRPLFYNLVVMTTLDYFTSIDLAEIERFGAERQEGYLTLMFNTVNHPSIVVEHRKNFSVALSDLANSNGGIIIWGD